MVLKGHVEGGVIVLDDQEMLPEGRRVQVIPDPEPIDDSAFLSLRGSVLAFPDPLASGLPAADWEMLK